MTFRQLLAGFVLCYAVAIRVEQDWTSAVGFAFFFCAWMMYSAILNWGKEA